MIAVLSDTFFDTLKMLPFLIITFVVIEIFEHKFGKKYDEKIKSAGRLGPVIGALLGIIPQCGFSVMAVAFYSQGYLSLGTLISIFIATSDEALPVLISTPGAASEILPFIVTKLVLAVIFGYMIDIVLKKRKGSIASIKEEENHGGCCGEECVYTPLNFKNIAYHSLKRAFKIAVYIYIITFAISMLMENKSIETFILSTGSNSIIQPVVSAFIGLIPNCAVSVGFIKLYLMGAIGFASAIAGLSSNAGLALLVLFKEENSKKEAVYITLLLAACSIASGIILTVLKI